MLNLTQNLRLSLGHPIKKGVFISKKRGTSIYTNSKILLYYNLHEHVHKCLLYFRSLITEESQAQFVKAHKPIIKTKQANVMNVLVINVMKPSRPWGVLICKPC